MRLAGKDVHIDGRLLRIGRLAAEGFEFLEDPEAMLADLANSGTRLDLFTFTQKLPGTAPERKYLMEWDNVAAVPVSTFEHWWKRQIDAKTRNMVRRGEKKGVVLREVAFDDALVRGIWKIYNECPVRQGRVFPHFGKDIDAVRRMSATFLNSSVFIGAYYQDELIGFVKLTVDEARSQAAMMHIIALVAQRDKAATNSLIAAAVKACEQRAIPFLVYSKFSYWGKQKDSLSQFKERNGFRRFDVPRYYLPLTGLGKLALKHGMHHGVRGSIPEPLVARLLQWREQWNSRKRGSPA